MNYVNNGMPLQKSPECPETVWRDILVAVQFAMRIHIDAGMAKKWNKYYHSYIIKDNDIKIVNNEPLAKYLGIPVGQRYYIVEKELLISLHCDGCAIPKTPSHIKTTTHVDLVLHVFEEEGLIHGHYNKVGIVTSGLSNHDERFIKLFQDIINRFDLNGIFNVWSRVKKCFMIFAYNMVANADWPVRSGVYHGCIGHAGKFRIVGILHIIGKEMVGVQFTNEDLLEALKV
jgi:hypothetical protein